MSPPVLLGALEGHGRLTPWLGYVSVLLVILVTLLGIWLLVRTALQSGPGDDDEQGGGSGGGGPRTPAPPTSGPDGDPDWWPEFERAFEAHEASRLAQPD